MLPRLVEAVSGARFATLDDLHERAIAAAVAAMEKDHRAPFRFLLKAGDWLVTWDTPWDNDREKITYCRMMRLQMKAIGCEAYAFSGEVWIAAPKPGDGINPKLPPSKRPDREDALFVMSYDKAANFRTTRFAVKRAGTPRARLLARDDWHEIPGERKSQINWSEGRMADMLNPAGKLHEPPEQRALFGGMPDPWEYDAPDAEEQELIFMIRAAWRKDFG